MIDIFFFLLVGHALADFALQNEAMAKGKNRNNKPANVPAGQKLTPCWPYWLTAHALIHGGCVAVVTGSVLIGALEVCTHWAIDFAKCENWLGVHGDQGLHFACKIFWIQLLLAFGGVS